MWDSVEQQRSFAIPQEKLQHVPSENLLEKYPKHDICQITEIKTIHETNIIFVHADVNMLLKETDHLVKHNTKHLNRQDSLKTHSGSGVSS